MSLTLVHKNPPNGEMTFTIGKDAAPFPPQTWTVLATGCSPSQVQISELVVASVAADQEIGTPFIEVRFQMNDALLSSPAAPKTLSDREVAEVIERLALSRVSAAPLSCISKEFSNTLSFKTWEFPYDGELSTALEVTASWGERASITLQVHIRGQNPDRSTLSQALGTDLLRAICWHESTFRQFGTNGRPLKNATTPDYGCMQINGATKTEAWHWPTNVARGGQILAEKENQASAWLVKHPPFTRDAGKRNTSAL
jgi:hypothetical protein